MFSFFKRPQVVIRHRADHCISRKSISRDALRVLYRLSDAGYKAYLVGGGVRDILLGREPKDFDVGTDAQPNEIKRLFPRCFLVGKRFRLAHVVFGRNVIETATFRKQPPPGEDVDDGGLYQADDNTFGTPEEDARRRDFTVNGLFYDIKTFDVIDYVGGLRDLDRRILRSIGDPNFRFQEDPVRMMRAIRLACKLGLTIERGTLKAIRRHYREIEKASVPRILEEIFRMFSFSAAEASFRMMWETRLLSVLMPHLNDFIDANGGKRCKVWNCLAEFDKLTQGRGEDISNGLRVAAIYLALYHGRLAESPAPLGRGARLDLAGDVITTMSDRYKMPRSAHFHAVHLLEELACFEKMPPPNRTIRPGRAEQFADAVVLARICAAVYGDIPAEHISAWAVLRVEGSPRSALRGGNAPGAPSPRRERNGGRGNGGRREAAEAVSEGQGDGDAQAGDAQAGSAQADGAQADGEVPEGQPAAGDGFRRGRRRRRGGRGRGRRHGRPDGDTTEQPGDVTDQPGGPDSSDSIA